VIFDCDGVLVDSEPISIRVLRETITAEHLRRIRARLFEEFREGLQAIDGIGDALDALGVPYCVASSSKPERIRHSLAVTGLLDRFEPRIYSSTMVTHGKPAPDLFLLAARDMGARPAACLVVEDSAAGIEAAKRAGMRVFAFTGGSHGVPGDLRGKAAALDPELIFDDMRLLPQLMRPEHTGTPI
jgi:HAD superfamily hydrolase (TIGR01509 family)